MEYRLGLLILIIGIPGFILSSFMIKHDPAWLSIMLVTIIASIIAVKIIDKSL